MSPNTSTIQIETKRELYVRARQASSSEASRWPDVKRCRMMGPTGVPSPFAAIHHILSSPTKRERWTAMCMPSLSCQDRSDWELTLIPFCPRPTTTTTTPRHSASFHHEYDVHQRRIDQSDGGGVEFQQPRPPLSGSSFAFKQKAAFLPGERLSHLVISHLHHNLHY